MKVTECLLSFGAESFALHFAIWKGKKNRIRKTIILPVVYGCETWSPILREERRLRMFENRVVRRMFGPKRDEIIGKWRIPLNEEFTDLYS
jgi:hypothetical protein